MSAINSWRKRSSKKATPELIPTTCLPPRFPSWSLKLGWKCFFACHQEMKADKVDGISWLEFYRFVYSCVGRLPKYITYSTSNVQVQRKRFQNAMARFAFYAIDLNSNFPWFGPKISFFPYKIGASFKNVKIAFNFGMPTVLWEVYWNCKI